LRLRECPPTAGAPHSGRSNFAWFFKLLMPSYLVEEALLSPSHSLPSIFWRLHAPEHYSSSQCNKVAGMLPGSALNSPFCCPLAGRPCKGTLLEVIFSAMKTVMLLNLRLSYPLAKLALTSSVGRRMRLIFRPCQWDLDLKCRPLLSVRDCKVYGF